MLAGPNKEASRAAERDQRPHDPAAVHASIGAIFSAPVARASFAECVTWAHERDLPIIGTSPAASLDFRSMRDRAPFILLMGSEGRELAAEQLARCDQVVRVPMACHCDSLSLAVATSVILYQAIGQEPPVEESKGERRDD